MYLRKHQICLIIFIFSWVVNGNILTTRSTDLVNTVSTLVSKTVSSVNLQDLLCVVLSVSVISMVAYSLSHTPENSPIRKMKFHFAYIGNFRHIHEKEPETITSTKSELVKRIEKKKAVALSQSDKKQR